MTCPITFAAGLVNMPCRLDEGHDGDHELNDVVTFGTEWAEETHEARRFATEYPEPTELGHLVEWEDGYAIKIDRRTPGQWVIVDGIIWDYSRDWWDVVEIRNSRDGS